MTAKNPLRSILLSSLTLAATLAVSQPLNAAPVSQPPAGDVGQQNVVYMPIGFAFGQTSNSSGSYSGGGGGGGGGGFFGGGGGGGGGGGFFVGGGGGGGGGGSFAALPPPPAPGRGSESNLAGPANDAIAQVPDSGSSLALFVGVLAALGLARRRRSSSAR